MQDFQRGLSRLIGTRCGELSMMPDKLPRRLGRAAVVLELEDRSFRLPDGDHQGEFAGRGPALPRRAIVNRVKELTEGHQHLLMSRPDTSTTSPSRDEALRRLGWDVGHRRRRNQGNVIHLSKPRPIAVPRRLAA